VAQVTIYLNDELAKRMSTTARARKLSRSAWIAEAIEDKLADEWPAGIRELAGSWREGVDRDEVAISDSSGQDPASAQDVPRETL
jgi:predicted transcriptional regulator